MLMYSGRVFNSCSTRNTHCVTEKWHEHWMIWKSCCVGHQYTEINYKKTNNTWIKHEYSQNKWKGSQISELRRWLCVIGQNEKYESPLKIRWQFRFPVMANSLCFTNTVTFVKISKRLIFIVLLPIVHID